MFHYPGNLSSFPAWYISLLPHSLPQHIDRNVISRPHLGPDLGICKKFISSDPLSQGLLVIIFNNLLGICGISSLRSPISKNMPSPLTLLSLITKTPPHSSLLHILPLCTHLLYFEIIISLFISGILKLHLFTFSPADPIRNVKTFFTLSALHQKSYWQENRFSSVK